MICWCVFFKSCTSIRYLNYKNCGTFGQFVRIIGIFHDAIESNCGVHLRIGDAFDSVCRNCRQLKTSMKITRYMKVEIVIYALDIKNFSPAFLVIEEHARYMKMCDIEIFTLVCIVLRFSL